MRFDGEPAKIGREVVLHLLCLSAKSDEDDDFSSAEARQIEQEGLCRVMEVESLLAGSGGITQQVAPGGGESGRQERFQRDCQAKA